MSGVVRGCQGCIGGLAVTVHTQGPEGVQGALEDL